MQNKLIIPTMAAILILMTTAAFAQTDPVPGTGNGNGVCGFLDEDGDGFNDLAPDADGDGIPNGLDPDFVKPQDGTGQQFGHQQNETKGWGRYFQLMNELATHVQAANGPGGSGSGGFGPGDGSGLGTGPADGSGFGPGDGSGDCNEDGGTLANRGNRRGGGK